MKMTFISTPDMGLNGHLNAWIAEIKRREETMKPIRKNKNGVFSQVYKVVVTDEKGSLRSLMYPLATGYFGDLNWYEKAKLRRNSLYYSPGYWTYPKMGKIFAFRTLKGATDFAWSNRNSSSAEIWEAEATGAEVAGISWLLEPWKPLAELRKWWKGLKEDPDRWSSTVPWETVFCDGLRLVKNRGRVE